MTTREMTLANLPATVEGNDIVLLDFWAGWCGPCRMFAPVFEAASLRHPDVVFGKVDTEAQRELAGMFGVTSIPTLVAFRERVVVFAQPGAMSARDLDRVVEAVRGLDMADVRARLASQEQGREQGQQGQEQGGEPVRGRAPERSEARR